MIITNNDDEEVVKLRVELSIRFRIKDLGELSHFLSLEVESMKDEIFVSQKSYAKKIVNKFELNQSKRCYIPLDANIKLWHEKWKLLLDLWSYRALVGNLIYLTITRPNIVFLVVLLTVICKFLVEHIWMRQNES